MEREALLTVRVDSARYAICDFDVQLGDDVLCGPLELRKRVFFESTSYAPG